MPPLYKSNLRGDGVVLNYIYEIIDNKEVLHCEHGPAIFNNNFEEWYQNGHKHRKNGPAVFIKKQDYIRAEWWVNGVLHRDNKPAIIDSEGIMEYWQNGEQVNSIS
jgi:hypothetical protein